MATALVEEENPKSTVILERQEDLRYLERYVLYTCSLFLMNLVDFNVDVVIAGMAGVSFSSFLVRY